MAVSRKGQIDMTIGHIMKNIILYAIPIIIGNVLNQLYTTVYGGGRNEFTAG